MRHIRQSVYVHSHWHKHKVLPLDLVLDLDPHQHYWTEEPDDSHEHWHTADEPHFHAGGPRGVWDAVRWLILGAMRRLG